MSTINILYREFILWQIITSLLFVFCALASVYLV